LYDQSLNRWSEKFIQRLPDSLEDRAFCKLLYETAFVDPLYVPLQARLEKVIEHNVSLDCLLMSKRNFLQQVDRIAAASADVLCLRNEQALEVIKTLGVLIVGVAGADLAPSLDGEEIPEDVQNLLASFSSRPIFIKNAERIIQGVRSDYPHN
jgi:hypothetical protein